MINIIGSILGVSGYDSHTRQLANALNKLTNVRLTIPIGPGWERQVTDQELQMIKRKPEKDEINLIITLPIFWKFHTVAKRNWAFLVWEGDSIPEYFIEEIGNPEIEYVLVPSSHTKNAILTTLNKIDNKEKITYCERKIRIIPHGVDLNLFYPKEQTKERFTFLCNKGFRNLEDRGGIQFAIRAYMEEFTDKDKVEMFIKINPAYGLIDMNKAIKEITPRNENLPTIRIDPTAKPFNEMVSIYSQGDILVSPTRAEAFNLPGIEAQACGLPTIQTGFGGQVDYMDKEIDFFIDYDLTEVKWELQYESISWATPKIDHLRRIMRYCYDHQDEVKVRGKMAIENARKWTWDNSAKLLTALI